MSEGLDFSHIINEQRAFESQLWQDECIQLRKENEELQSLAAVQRITHEWRQKVERLQDEVTRWRSAAAKLSLAKPGLGYPPDCTPENFLTTQLDGITELRNEIDRLKKENQKYLRKEIADAQRSTDCL